ncbi:hypothetical protein VUR80DRAFT_1902 [Thermomyces stellatus]
MATRLVSATPTSLPTGRPSVSHTPEEELPQDNLIVEFNVIIWVLVGVSGFFFLLRSYCKITRQRGLWWDDHVMGLAWLTLIVSSIFGSISTTMGFGHHSWNVDTQGPSFSTLLLIMNHTGFWSILGTAWSKTSFAITLLRISEGRIRWIIWAVIVSVNVVLYLGALFMWLQCNPPAKTYTPWLDGECWKPQVIIAYNSFTAAWSGLSDIILAIIPWWIIARHSMNVKERIGLLTCMSLGVFAGLTSFAKTVTLPAIGNDDLIRTVPLNILGIAEAAVTIIAASIPVLRALLTKGNPSKLGSSGLTPTPIMGSSRGWRDYEVLKAESNVKLAKLKPHAAPSPKAPDDGRRGW